MADLPATNISSLPPKVRQKSEAQKRSRKRNTKVGSTNVTPSGLSFFARTLLHAAPDLAHFRHCVYVFHKLGKLELLCECKVLCCTALLFISLRGRKKSAGLIAFIPEIRLNFYTALCKPREKEAISA